MNLDDEPVRARRDRRARHRRDRAASPMPCDGSTMTGRCESCLSSGIGVESSVLRVIVSKVRMPRSQRITWRLPRATMYSAAISNSLIVAHMPRLSSTGLPQLAHRLEQREVLHVARADLEDVRVLGHQSTGLGVHHLGDDRQAGLLARLRRAA